MALDAVSISAIVALVTIVTFYLNHVRHKRALYLTFVPSTFFPDIALVNGSKSEVTLTSVSYIFHNTPGRYLEYAQATEWSDPKLLSLSSGKGVRAHITFKAPFDAAFVESGIYDRPNDCFVHSLYLSVKWIRNDGKPCSAFVHALDVGIESGGRIKYCCNIPQALSYNLYKLKKTKKLV